MAASPSRENTDQSLAGGVTPAVANLIRARAWPDFWAALLKLAVDGHPFDVEGREYEQAILRDESKVIIVPKGAQLGFTTLFVIKSLHAILERHWHVLYLLPLKAGSVQFVQSRIDPIIDSNSTLKSAFKRVDNRNQKVTPEGIKWYIRGTNIASELREVPADILVLDERDVANEDNLDDARARLDGSSIARTYELSTPTIDGHGVYSEMGWASTDQMRWWVRCPHCSDWQCLSFEEHVYPYLGESIEESQDSCRCSHCHMVLTDEHRAAMNSTGKWVPDNAKAMKRGYHLNQLNSPTKKLADPQLGILVNYFLGQRDSKKLKAFFNLALGLPYAAAGDKFTPELLDSARRSYSLMGVPDGPLYIGIDQGYDILYVTIYTRRQNTKQLRLWNALTVQAKGTATKWQMLEEEVLRPLSNWNVVCDAHPDKEQVERLSKRYQGRFWMGFEKDRPDQHETANFIPHKWDEPAKVNIDRTMAFDSYIHHFINGNILLPREARELGGHLPKLGYNEFYNHHLAMVRVEQPDTQGRDVARWINTRGSQGKKPDHFHHSGMFALVASMGEVPLEVPQELGSLFRSSGGLIGANLTAEGVE
jgi:hypothetical protein